MSTLNATRECKKNVPFNAGLPIELCIPPLFHNMYCTHRMNTWKRSTPTRVGYVLERYRQEVPIYKYIKKYMYFFRTKTMQLWVIREKERKRDARRNAGRGSSRGGAAHSSHKDEWREKRKIKPYVRCYEFSYFKRAPSKGAACVERTCILYIAIVNQFCQSLSQEQMWRAERVKESERTSVVWSSLMKL